jgi:hypothetical protein
LFFLPHWSFSRWFERISFLWRSCSLSIYPASRALLAGLCRYPDISIVPECPANGIEMSFNPVDPAFIQVTELMVERTFFLCPNCGRVANNFAVELH